MKRPYLEPTQEAGAALFSRNIQGPVVMLNLLRFREVADYSDFPDLAPDQPISGKQAYEKYMALTQPHLEATGGELLFEGSGSSFLIGPSDETWDMVLLVKQNSLADFMGFTSNEAYMAGLAHRTAALADSRLLPLIENER